MASAASSKGIMGPKIMYGGIRLSRFWMCVYLTCLEIELSRFSIREIAKISIYEWSVPTQFWAVRSMDSIP